MHKLILQLSAVADVEKEERRHEETNVDSGVSYPYTSLIGM